MITGVIEKSIFVVQGHTVMLDSDLAKLYGVPTHRLNEQVKRNISRFPQDFMFRLSEEDAIFLRSQNAISKYGKGGRRYLPYVFTEQGIAMLSSVLNSPKAIAVNIQIMRTFVKLRQMMSKNEELAQKIHQLEEKYDGQFKVVFEAIRRLLAAPESKTKRRKIGFTAHQDS